MPDRSRSLRCAALGLAAAALGALALAAALWPAWLFDGNWHAVVPGRVYRSAQPDPEALVQRIERFGLRSVISTRGGEGSPWFERERAAAAAAGARVEAVRLSGSRMPSPAALARLVRLIETLPQPLLLHCASGSERSGLASAVTLLLAGLPPEQARAQFARRFGFWPRLSGSRLPLAIEDYARWLRDRALPHTPERFRTWVARHYVPEFYRAAIEILEPPAPLAAGARPRLRLRVRNASDRPWRFGPSKRGGVHVWVELAGLASASGFRHQRRLGFDARELAPGASREFEVPLWKLPECGRYRLEVDLVDEGVAFFSAMGSPPLRLELEVAPAASRSHVPAPPCR